MNNTPNSIWEKKLPPFSGLVLVAISLVTIAWLTGNVVLFGTRAAVGGVPEKVQITNITDTSFTVTYQTEYPMLGSIRYGTDTTLNASTLDDRDQIINKAVEHRIHHITVKSLAPGTKYMFEISSGGETYKNNDALYEVTTAPPLPEQTTSPPPLTGQVELEDGSFPVEGIVYVLSNTSQTLSALLRPDGSYEIPLQLLRNSDLSGWAPLTAATQLNVTVEAPALKSTAVVLADQADKTPLMVLSKNYDFSISDSQLAADASGSAEASDSATVPPIDLPIPQDTTIVTSPKITTPDEDQSFNDLQPKFEGKAIAGTAVEVVMETQPEISAIVQADENGNWEYRPEAPLSPGKQTITITAQDSQGTTQTVSQSFIVFAEGSQFIEPSVSPPILPTPVAQPPTMTPAPTIEPTAPPEPSPTLVIISPDPNASGSPGGFDPNAGNGNGTGHGSPPVPDSGSSSWLFGIAAIIFAAGAGALLFFFI